MMVARVIGVAVFLAATTGWAADGPPPPTYGRDIAPLLERHCRECHRKGRVGPFELDTYKQARKRSGDIAAVVVARTMPPWKPEPGFGPRLKNERVMPAADVARIVAWADLGAPEGGPAPERSGLANRDGWPLGTPDVVLEMAEPFEVPASGEDVYRCFVLPTDLPKDAYVEAVAFRAGNARVVHHMTSWVDAGREGRKKDAKDAKPGYSSFSGAGVPTFGDLGGWAPGNDAARLPEGVGRPLPKGADVILQVHYHPRGRVESDRSRMGLYLAKGPVRQTLQWNGAGNFTFRLPAGAARFEVKASWVVPIDVEALAVAPHMHRLGRDMTMDVRFPDGKSRDLIKIGDWDVSWQNTYYFEEAVDLPKGSVVRVLAHFDNSAANPRNPDRPPKAVGWGEGSSQEMCVGYIAVVKKGQDLTKPGEVDDLFPLFVRQREDDLGAQRRFRKRHGAQSRVPEVGLRND